MKNLLLAFALMFIGVVADAQNYNEELRDLAIKRVETLTANLKLNKVQKAKVLDIHHVYAENLLNEVRKNGMELNIDSVIKVMGKELPYVIDEIMALLDDKQKKRYKEDLLKHGVDVDKKIQQTKK